jgi:MoaA/NifB/PqqE/SkfB family radical SAM enzyme
MTHKRQLEMQLGHMCNNRCVFCVSGQMTQLGRARPLEAAPLLAELERAHAAGYRTITLLGGEPTLQPAFMDLVRRAVALGFDEIVIFTNGAKTARAEFIDAVRATGGRFSWRLSIQGGTKEAHEATTKKPGSFDRLVRTMDALRARGETITVNLCVVQSNMHSVDAFPELLVPRGVSQLHLDMMRPLDAGERTEEELRAAMPRYSDLVPAFTRMVHGFPDGFDVNIGNLPYCVAPELSPWIHHDGEPTATIAVDREHDLSEPWDKYEVKRRDKEKPVSCRACVMDARCSGVFATYRAFYGTGELTPVTPERLRAADPRGRLLAIHLGARLAPHAPLDASLAVEAASDAELTMRSRDGADALVLSLRASGSGEGIAAYDGVTVHLARAPRDRRAGARALAEAHAWITRAGLCAVHPIGADALGLSSRALAASLMRLRRGAPFSPLHWTALDVQPDGLGVEARFEGPSGERATLWLRDERGRTVGGYRVEGAATDPVVQGLGAALAVLRGRGATGAPAAPPR